MQYILLFILSIPFLYINYKIIISDIKEKKIPNKYLLYLLILLPIYYIYVFYYFDINFLFFLFQVVITLFLSFLLYSIGIWSAGDAKYLLVLALFIPYIGIISFVGNIAIITLIYLMLYFVWFYLGKCLFDRKYAKSLLINIKEDLKEKLTTFFKFGDGNFYIKTIFLRLIKFFITFGILFVGLRISRIYLMKDLNYFDLFNKYQILIIISSIVIILLSIMLLRLIYIFIKKISINQIYYKYIDIIIYIILLSLLFGFILYEYKIDSEFLKNSLYKIFTIYLLLYILFNIFRYSYKITFQIAESYFVTLDNIKIGDIIDKEYITKIIKIINPKNLDTINIYNENLKNIKSINRVVTEEDITKINTVFLRTNEVSKNDEIIKEKFTELNHIKILKIFAFGPYILLGFLITFIFGNKIFEVIINLIIKYIRDIYN
ncbi:MAG: hypothetical protein PHV23_03405 [Candidatus Gracilibacteria bacterium]|nr:hypothetical protein [Candidatus Gracilibacteria bacterium]